eukprot:Sspe_Gene.72853::Locus_43662_Transcript_1_1_Confidence_1.000_Length_2056::g.72853::m.72853/K00681/ggt; gamma-glutamyltranspeptidase / glutathione hydrolase
MLVLLLLAGMVWGGTAGKCVLSEDVHICSGLRADAPRTSECCVESSAVPDPNMRNCGGTRPVGLPFAGRSPVYARKGMAATSQPLSTMCAMDILKAGGSAVDAAIAANACEGVVEPMMNGMGGDLMAQVWHGPSRTLHGYNGAGRSPSALSRKEMEQEVGSAGGRYIPLHGPLPVSVPGAVKGWCDLHERFGVLPWEALFGPAIAHASEGFPVSPVIAAEWGIPSNSSDMTSHGRFPRALDGFVSTFTVPDGKGGRRAPRVGEIFRNPDLASTLELVAKGGCQEFYNGSIAGKIAEFSKVAGTKITAQDLAKHRGEWVTPVNSTYRGDYMIFELPPNPQGIATLQMLNILERHNLTRLGHNTPDYLHLHIEAKKLAFADRAKFYGDPDFGEPTPQMIEWLISKSYAEERDKLIDMSSAAREVTPGVPPSPSTAGWFPRTASQQDFPRAGDTIYLTVADANGTMVSLIQSVYEGFGSGLVVPGLGFPLQDRGALFNLPGLTNQHTASDYAPGKRPFHTIIPGFAMKKEKGEWGPWLSFGVMGGNFQPQGQVQVLCNIIDFGMNLQEAGDAARWAHMGSSQPTGEVMTDGGEVQLERGVCLGTEVNLTSRGHKIIRGHSGGGYQAIAYDRETGVYTGASEMRKDGMAAGW